MSVRQRKKSIHQHRFLVIEIKVLSIWKNFDRQNGIDVGGKILFRVENHVEVKVVQIPSAKFP